MARILVAHVTAVPNKISGITVYTWCILRALALHGRHEYVLVTNWDLDRLPPAIAELTIEKHHRPSFKNETLSLLQNTVRLPALARQLNCAAIFFPQPVSMLFGLQSSVVVLHDLYRVTHAALYSASQKLQWTHLIARGFRRAKRIVAVSGATRDAVVEAYPETANRTIVVHEASPLALPETLPPAPPIEAPFALMVANLSPNKNVAVVVEALKRLADRGVHPRLCLVGRDNSGALTRLTEGRTDLNIHRLDNLSDPELARYYAHARVYVNASLVEGFCLPLLEAQTFGLPVICSDLPVLHEVAGDAAIFVDPHDAEAMADALERLFGDDALAADLAARAEINARRFSWARAARETESVLDQVLPA